MPSTSRVDYSCRNFRLVDLNVGPAHNLRLTQVITGGRPTNTPRSLGSAVPCKGLSIREGLTVHVDDDVGRRLQWVPNETSVRMLFVQA